MFSFIAFLFSIRCKKLVESTSPKIFEIILTPQKIFKLF